MSKFNYLTDYAALYKEDTEGNSYPIGDYPMDWIFLNESSTPRIDEVTFRHSSRLSIEIRNPNTESYTFEHNDSIIPSDKVSSEFSFNAMFKCAAPANVAIYLHDSLEPFSSVEPVITELATSEWTACFSNVFEFADKNRPVYGLHVRIVISLHGGKIVHFTMPNLVEDKPFLSSTYYNPARSFFPDVYYDVDSEQTSPTFPFLKLWHSLTGVADTVMKEYLEIFQYEDAEKPVSIKSQLDSDEYNSFYSKLTNPETMPAEYMQWASMFIGNLIKSGIYVAPSFVKQTIPITYQIGDTGPAGGKIFITPSTAGNTTGMYFEAGPTTNFASSPPSSEVQRSWSTGANQSVAVSGADGTAIGTGAQNTIDIVAQAGNVAATSAAVYCSEYTYGGFSDWFLPSKDELNQMYLNRVAIGFQNDNYYSSSENLTSAAWFHYFPTNVVNALSKANVMRTRPVRMFDSGTEEITVSTGSYQEVFDGGVDFKRKQISTRMYGFSAGTKGAIKNAARAVIGEDAAVVITPNWDNDQWSIMVRTVTASTPGVTGSGQSSSTVYYAMEPAKPVGYRLLHETLDEITFVLDDNDFGVFDQSVLG